MVRTVLTALFAVALSCMISIPVLAQDKAQQPPKEEGKDMMKMEGLKMVSCDPACGFRIVSHDEAEIVDMVKQHMKKHHDKKVADEEVRKMIKDAPPKGMKGGAPPDAKPPKP